MSSSIVFVPTVQKPLLRLPSFGFIKNYASNLMKPQKIIIVSIGVGIALFTVASYYFRRRRRLPKKSALSNSNDPNRQRKGKPITIRRPSGEFYSYVSSGSPSFHRSSHRHTSVSVCSDKASVASFIPSQAGETSFLTPQQYGVMGMESLESAIGLWEEALSSYTNGTLQSAALPSSDEAEFTQLLQRVIEHSYSLQDQCEALFLNQHSVLFRSAVDLSGDESDVSPEHTDKRTMTYASISSLDSFVSCQGDIGNLKDLEDFEEEIPLLYLSALKHHEEHSIPFRNMRTDWVKCNSDLEYVCKVHCLRLASHVIFSQAANKEWFAEAGRELIHSILMRADKDPKDALSGYDDFLFYLTECNWIEVEEELRSKGVKTLTFYDVVLDFIIMDAFDDLENPPSSVLAVVQNRWLSNGFKETALTTAVWSVLKAKRRLMRHQEGFLAHFYDVMEHLSPILAWGFLGPDIRFKDLCNIFRDQIKGLIQDMFSFTTVRYSSIEDLSFDILQLTRERYRILIDKFTIQTNGIL